MWVRSVRTDFAIEEYLYDLHRKLGIYMLYRSLSIIK
jgi:hypothetical protein